MRFRLFGVPVRIHPTFWLIALALGANLQPQPVSALVWLATLLGVLLAGELAVAQSLRSLGYAPTIWFHWAGAETSVAVAKPGQVGQLLAAYASGPLVVLMLAGLLAGVARVWPAPLLHDAVLVATFWGIASLMPIRPLVGGKMLQVALTRTFGARTETLTRVVSIVLTPAALALILSTAWTFAGFLLVMVCLWVNVSALRQTRLDRKDQRSAADYNAGVAALRDKDGGPARALEIGERLARSAQSMAWKARARELQAWAHLIAGNLDAAEAVLERMPPGAEPDPLLEGSIYLQRKEWKHAATLLADALEKHENDDTAARLAHALIQDRRSSEALRLADRAFAGPKTFDQLLTVLFYAKQYDAARALGLRWWAAEKNPRLGFNLACIEARAGKPTEACRWLDEAVAAGWRDLARIDGDPDLESIRKLPEFHQTRARLTSLGRVVG